MIDHDGVDGPRTSKPPLFAVCSAPRWPSFPVGAADVAVAVAHTVTGLGRPRDQMSTCRKRLRRFSEALPFAAV
jgi:hypothetical protein